MEKQTRQQQNKQIWVYYKCENVKCNSEEGIRLENDNPLRLSKACLICGWNAKKVIKETRKVLQ